MSAAPVGVQASACPSRRQETPDTLKRELQRPALTALTSVRFFAAFLVLLFHALDSFAMASVLQLPRPILNVFESGFVGVSVFFILSGFILAYNYLERDFTEPCHRRQFWVARFARIYPVYLLGAVLAAPKFFAALAAPDVWAKAREASLTGGAVLVLVQAWVPNLALAWNSPGWSLSVEAFFYLLFPFAALWFAKLSKRGALLGLGLCWIAALMPPLVYGWLAPASPAWSAFVKFNPLLRLPEFLLGICLGVVFLAAMKAEPAAKPSRWIHTGLLLAMTTAGAGLLFRDALPKHLFHNGLLDPAFAFIIFALAWCGLSDNRLNRLLSMPALILLGEASYALYILHVPIKGWLVAAVGRWFPHALDDARQLSFVVLAYVVLSHAAAIVSYKFLEVPARRWISNRFTRGQHIQQSSPTRAANNFLLAKGAKP